ncbi:MAG: hypothetical protein NZL96_02705 [Patescibacteria group bacterium]|nr:hypothetical protein [Patescibacteria group bacterium]
MKKFCLVTINFFLLFPLNFLIGSAFLFFLGFNFGFPFDWRSSLVFYSVIISGLFFLETRSSLFERKLFYGLLIFVIFFFQLYLFYSSFRTALFPHHAHDASNHAFFVKRIRETKKADTSSLLIEVPVKEFFIGGDETKKDVEKKENDEKKIKPWYPLGLHTGAALICDLLKKENCLRTPWYLAWVFASSSVVGVYFVGKLFFGDKVGLIASMITTTFYLFPYMPFGWGGFGMVAGLFLTSFGFFAWSAFLRQGKFGDLILATLITVAIFYVHTTEILTLFLLVLIGNFKPIVETLKTKQSVYLVLSCFVILGSIFPAYVVGHQVQSEGVKIVSPADFHFNLEDLNFLLKYHLLDVNNNFFFIWLFFGGLIFFFEKKKILHPILVLAIFFLMFVVFSRYWAWFQKLIAFFYPWGNFERIFYTTFLMFPLVASLGFFWFQQRLKNFGRIIFFFLLLVLYLNTLFFTTKFISHLNQVLNPVTADDIRIFDYINKNKSKFKRAIFYNNPFNDAGAWLYETTGVITFFPTASSSGLSQEGKKFLYLFYEKKPEEICHKLKERKVDFLFVGSKTIPETDRFFDDGKIIQMKCLKIHKQDGKAKIYEVL